MKDKFALDARPRNDSLISIITDNCKRTGCSNIEDILPIGGASITNSTPTLTD